MANNFISLCFSKIPNFGLLLSPSNSLRNVLQHNEDELSTHVWLNNSRFILSSFLAPGILRHGCGKTNVMHSMAMGGFDLIGFFQ